MTQLGKFDPSVQLGPGQYYSISVHISCKFATSRIQSSLILWMIEDTQMYAEKGKKCTISRPWTYYCLSIGSIRQYNKISSDKVFFFQLVLYLKKVLLAGILFSFSANWFLLSLILICIPRRNKKCRQLEKRMFCKRSARRTITFICGDCIKAGRAQTILINTLQLFSAEHQSSTTFPVQKWNS